MKNFFSIILIFNLIIYNDCTAKRVINSKQHPNLQILDAETFTKIFPNTQKIHCFDKIYFEYPELSIENTLGHTDLEFKGYLNDIFLLNVPQGKGVFDNLGFFWINNIFIKEISAKMTLPNLNYQHIPGNTSLPKLNGTVAVLYQTWSHAYGHFILDILGMLAVLEMNNIQYDYICLP
jgi:hypothetical protein